MLVRLVGRDAHQPNRINDARGEPHRTRWCWHL